jgi:hypothetical protein
MSVRKFSSASISSVQPKGSKFWNQETFPGTYESISTAIVDSSGAASITFSSIPQNYSHLQIRGLARTNRSAGSTDTLFVRLNGETGNNYTIHDIYGNGSSANAENGVNTGYIKGFQVGSTADASGIFGLGIIDILDYTNTNKRRVVRIFGGVNTNDAGNENIQLSSGMLTNSTSALTSVLLYPGSGTAFEQHTHFSLYGIRGA